MLDLFVSLFNFFALSQSDKDADETFNYGRGKLEAMATAMEGTIVSLSGLFIMYDAVSKIYNSVELQRLDISVYVMIISIVITAALVLYLNYIAKVTNNMVIKADALHYKTDLYTNSAVLTSLVVIHYSGFVLIDPILGILIAIYMIYSAYPLIKEGVYMLLDASLPEEEVEKITAVLDNEMRINSYHHLKTRISANDYFITVHVVFNTSISLFDAHSISDDIELAIARLFEDKNVHTIIHMDPYDDSDCSEDEII